MDGELTLFNGSGGECVDGLDGTRNEGRLVSGNVNPVGLYLI